MKEALEIDRIAESVRLALKEDIGEGDITTSCIIPTDMIAEADIVVKERGIVCGLPVASYIFSQIPLYYPPLLKGGHGGICFTAVVDDGADVEPGFVAANVKGPARAILTGERVVLNFLQRLAGIATVTSKFVSKVSQYNTQIFDTRKTTPNWRYLERYAVRVGGGYNHRFGLYDQVLIKDNHLKCLSHKLNEGGNAIGEAVQVARKAHTDKLIEVEAETLEHVEQALDAGVDIIMLDNMNPEQIKQAVRIVGAYCNTPAKSQKRPILEVSGNITMETVEDIARLGVDRISVGALTHSVKALDIALEMR